MERKETPPRPGPGIMDIPLEYPPKTLFQKGFPGFRTHVRSRGKVETGEGTGDPDVPQANGSQEEVAGWKT